MTGKTISRNQGRACLLALGLMFAGLCLTPVWLRLRNPTIYADDVVRIVQLQTQPLGQLLFRPFNEHMAPLFEVVTWTTWELAGRRISRAPLAMVLASILPFVASLALLGLVIRRELGSTSTALAAVAIFGLASHDGEVFNWYSASSFTWASAATLLAWLGAVEASRTIANPRRLVGWLLVSFLGACSGPSFCAIGLIAGPLAALRLVTDASRSPRLVRWLGPLVPISGTVGYLAFCEFFRYRDVLATGLGRHVGLTTALWNMARAPVDVLVPGLVGIRNLDRILPDSLELVLTGLGMVSLLVWAWRSPTRRPMILGGLALIAGGYAVTYGVRTLPDARQVINVQRYHLFPHLGLVLLIAPGLALAFRRLDARPLAMLAAANTLALVMVWAHLPQMKEHLRFFRFPEQPPTLLALDRLESASRIQRVGRDQILTALDPIRPTWVPSEGNALEMLPLSTANAQRRADPGALRSALLGGLATEDVEALCGGMDASVYRKPTFSLATSGVPPTLARLVKRSRVEPTTGSERFVSAGWPAYLEYELGPEADQAQAIALSDVRSGRDVELWWADDDGRWSPNRTAWWKPEPGQEWALPLDRLPHWNRGHVRRLRVYFHEAGTVALAPPRLIR